MVVFEVPARKWKVCLEVSKTTKIWQKILKFSFFFRVYTLKELFLWDRLIYSFKLRMIRCSFCAFLIFLLPWLQFRFPNWYVYFMYDSPVTWFSCGVFSLEMQIQEWFYAPMNNIYLLTMWSAQESRREGWTDARSAVGFCLGSGLFGSYNSD